MEDKKIKLLLLKREELIKVKEHTSRLKKEMEEAIEDINVKLENEDIDKINIDTLKLLQLKKEFEIMSFEDEMLDFFINNIIDDLPIEYKTMLNVIVDYINTYLDKIVEEMYKVQSLMLNIEKKKANKLIEEYDEYKFIECMMKLARCESNMLNLRKYGIFLFPNIKVFGK